LDAFGSTGSCCNAYNGFPENFIKTNPQWTHHQEEGPVPIWVRPGWSVRRKRRRAGLTTPSAPLRWLRGFSCWRSHPSSQRRGISRFCQFSKLDSFTSSFANQAKLAGRAR
jgi:hypothetical protein